MVSTVVGHLLAVVRAEGADGMRRQDAMKLARERVERADRMLRDALRRWYPVGATVVWERPTHNHCFGTVVATADIWTRIKVRNKRTGVEYWLDEGQLID